MRLAALTRPSDWISEDRSPVIYAEAGEVAKMLMELGVDYLQGYYFGKPMNVRGWRKETP